MLGHPLVPLLPPRFQLVSILKESDRNCVYRVRDSVSGREEALKRLCDRVDPLKAMQFRTEFETLAAIEHPNIVRVFDFGVLAEGFPYFTMEYLPGRRLTEFFDGQQWERLYGVVLQIASALHHVHTRGILHLDVKPSNIAVSDDGSATLMDFGLAGHTERLLDRTIRGTLPYMAPEVLAQERVDSRADLYSLGMSLYETVTGTLPGYGRPTSEIIRMRLDEAVRRASAINPRIPEALDTIIARLLERDPRDRFPSAAALIDAVAEVSGAAPPISEVRVNAASTYAAPLIGREVEVEGLQRLIEGARAGAGGAVILTGREGTGKHRIIREVTLRAQLEGARVFCARCPANRQTVYAPFIDIFHAMLASVTPEAPFARETERLFTVEETKPVDSISGERGGKYRLFNRVGQSIEDIYGLLRANGGGTSSEPLILVVENLHWADVPTADLFAFLAGEATRKPLVVIGSLTTDTPDDEVADSNATDLAFWQSQAADSAIQFLQVDPLPEARVREYLAALLGNGSATDDFVKWVLWETGGLPLAIRRLVDRLAAEGHLTWSPAGWHVAEDVSALVELGGGTASLLADRMESIDPAQQIALEAAAVLGDRFASRHLLEACAGTEEETTRAVSALIRGGFLEESSNQRALAFPHTHLRQTIYSSIAEPRRADLHRRAGEVLEAERLAGTRHLIGQVAFHFARANDTLRGTTSSIEAGDHAAAALAFEEAAEFYRVALELMDLGGFDEGSKAEIREKLADAYFRRDDYRRAVHVYQFLLKSLHARGGDRDTSLDVARVTRKIGKVLARRGDLDGAMTHLQHALSIYEERGSPEDVAEVLNRLAWLHRLRDDLAAARAASARAKSVLAGRPLTPVTGYVENVLGIIEFAAGNWEASREAHERALAIGAEVGSAHLRRVAATNLGNTLWKLGDWSGALEHFRRSAEQSEVEGDLWELVTAYNNVGVVEHGRSNFAVAAALFEKSLEIGARLDSTEQEAPARENLGEALELLGRWPEALAQYERCLALDTFDESRASAVSVYVPLARLTRKRGDIAKALELGQKAIAAGERARDEDLLAEAHHALAGIEEERENLGDAERHVTRALELFGRSGTPHGLGRAHTTA
ncbi:MAG: tetratricopeptide repeat protein, partial [Thermoanaerobaculia bacterium]